MDPTSDSSQEDSFSSVSKSDELIPKLVRRLHHRDDHGQKHEMEHGNIGQRQSEHRHHRRKAIEEVLQSTSSSSESTSDSIHIRKEKRRHADKSPKRQSRKSKHKTKPKKTRVDKHRKKLVHGHLVTTLRNRALATATESSLTTVALLIDLHRQMEQLLPKNNIFDTIEECIILSADSATRSNLAAYFADNTAVDFAKRLEIPYHSTQLPHRVQCSKQLHPIRRLR
ncbi:hypothetical protein BLNAU_8596 [Blattamonas nauphoetae]|uniref:Uncharacterized protein n=1 Tax=Blattamonas nauphoetae TaxID=2049346 RepID=A0ABQ9XY39_9EUKA|nr:hypothetical protein BLNAU_8596 [Blattamonas nauphoetae]